MSKNDNAQISAVFAVYLLIFIVPQIVLIAHSLIREKDELDMLGAICFLFSIGLLIFLLVFFKKRGGGVHFAVKLTDTEYGIAQLYKTFFRYPLVYLFATFAIVYSIYAITQFLNNRNKKQLIVHCIAITAWIISFIVNVVYISIYHSHQDAIKVFAVNCSMTGIAVIAEIVLLSIVLHNKLKASKS